MKNIAENKFKSELKFVYSDNDTLSIIFQKNEILLGVVGEFNNNIKQLDIADGLGKNTSQLMNTLMAYKF